MKHRKFHAEKWMIKNVIESGKRDIWTIFVVFVVVINIIRFWFWFWLILTHKKQWLRNENREVTDTYMYGGETSRETCSFSMWKTRSH